MAGMITLWSSWNKSALLSDGAGTVASIRLSGSSRRDQKPSEMTKGEQINNTIKQRPLVRKCNTACLHHSLDGRRTGVHTVKDAQGGSTMTSHLGNRVPRRGRIVRHSCSCGWAGEELLVGGGTGEEFALVESFPCTCPACKALVHRFLPREGADPAALRELAAGRGDTAAGGLPGRALRAIADEAESGRVLCPYCRLGELAVHRSAPPPCPSCGAPCRETEIGTWR